MVFTADVVCVDRDGRLLLIKRKWEPFAGKWALPGGYVDEGEESRYAAARELAEETGVVVSPADLVFIGKFDAVGRDPRGLYSTDAYLAVVPPGTRAVAMDDAADAAWFREGDVLASILAFDHADILGAAAEITEMCL